jgi:exopolysaccharide biosynthesis protein
MVKSSIMECSGTAGRNKQPRQAIAQYENLDLLILSCGGRDKEKDGKSWGPGVTARDVAHLLLFEGVKFGFLLDDGGSVMTVVDGQRLTPQFDDAGDRKRPNFLWIEAP